MHGATEAAAARAEDTNSAELSSEAKQTKDDGTGDVKKVLTEATHREVAVEERVSFPYLQAVAPMTGEEWPHRRDFVAAQFRDLSQHGFSFITNAPPQCKLLAVELGWQPCCYCFVSQIVNCTQEYLADGRAVYRVGCKFVRRVNR